MTLLASLSSWATLVHQANPQDSGAVIIQGMVLGLDGKPIEGAVVQLERKGVSGVSKNNTDTTGAFMFSGIQPGTYQLSAKKSGSRSSVSVITASSKGERKKVELVLDAKTAISQEDINSSSSAASDPPMEFTDKPSFTIAGVTDWTAVGGHGSDSSLRTSESLANETASLQSNRPEYDIAFAGDPEESIKTEKNLLKALSIAPDSFEANRQLGTYYLHTGKSRDSIPLLQKAYRIDPTNRTNEYELALAYEKNNDLSQSRELVHDLTLHQNNADLHRLTGELNEKSDDPLGAVHEYEQAARLDPSEQNYFEWGSELLLHRAVWQAREVFQKGADTYPGSGRIQTGLGTALFAGALYSEAALHFCKASDLNPQDLEPYFFMGRVQIAAPDALACIEPKLAQFAHDHSENSLANYFYAMAILKRQEKSSDEQAVKKAEDLLMKAVTLDSKCGDAYLQLGTLYSSRHSFDKAISFYVKAIEANPRLGDAYYRLGVAYDRIGESAKARQEFQLHDEIKKQQAAEIESQRRSVKQFLVVVPGQPTFPPAQ